jgi:hypothetical protein
VARLIGVLDGRLHRVALLFTMLPLIAVGAFSLKQAPVARTVALAPDAFDSDAAKADLAKLMAFKGRKPGSDSDKAAADFVAQRLKAAGLKVWIEQRESPTVSGVTTTQVVHAVRTGFSQRKVFIAADRALPGSGEAPLSATAVLLELARDIGGRTVSHSVEFISTGAGVGGALAGWSPNQDDTVAAIVLGNQAAAVLHRPFVVPWAESRSVAAPLALERSAAGAVEQETGLDPGLASSGSRFARLAIPLSTTDQSGLLAGDVAAVGVGSSGERAIPADGIVGEQFAAFGRSALRLAGILDGAGPTWPGQPTADIPVRDRILPAWVLRLLGGLLVGVAVIVGVDGIARSRRRRIPVFAATRWFVATWPVFLLMWLWLLIAGMTGVISGVPASVAPARSVPMSWAALAGLPLAAAFGWLFIRPRAMPDASAILPPGELEPPGQAAPAVLMILASLAVGAIWIVAPVTALLALPFVHLAPWLVDRTRFIRKRVAVTALLATLIPLALALVVLATAFGMGPFALTWALALQFSGGAVGVVGGVVTTFLAGLFVGASVLVLRGHATGPEQFVTRGPLSYAGPGSLGGTESVLDRR